MDKATTVLQALADDYACPLCGEFIGVRRSDFELSWELVACRECNKKRNPDGSRDRAQWRQLRNAAKAPPNG